MKPKKKKRGRPVGPKRAILYARVHPSILSLVQSLADEVGISLSQATARLLLGGLEREGRLSEERPSE